MKKAPLRKRLRLEPLEHRQMMAGNVTASISNGDLIVDGDDLNNAITIESAGTNTVQVRGFNDTLGSATSVNGSPNALQIFSGFTGSVVVRINGGDDLVRVTNLVVNGSVIVDLAGGADEAVLGRDSATGDLRFAATPSGPLYVTGGVVITAGAGNDNVVQSDLHIQDGGTTDLGAGNDTLTVRRPPSSAANVEYAGSYFMLPGDGDDSLNVTGLVVGGSLTVDDATGVTTLNMTSMGVGVNFSVFTDQLNDQINISATNTHQTLNIVTEGGADYVNVSAIADLFLLNTGAANDDVHISSASIDELSLQLGLGNDALDLLNVYSSVLTARGSNGNDTFLARNVNAVDAFFYGDADFDTWRDSRALPNNIRNLQRFTIERFERL